MRTRGISVTAIACLVAIGALAWAQSAHAGGYPTNKCVGAKMKEAGKYCQSAFKAWSKWDKKQDDGERDLALTKAAGKLTEKWAKAETKSSGKGVDCAETTVSAADMLLLIGTGVGEVVSEVNNGLTLGNTPEGKCGMKFLKMAAKKCYGLLKAEAKHVKKPDKDPDRAILDENRDKASQQFTESWNKAATLGCTAGTSMTVVEELIDEISEDVVVATTVSPNVDDSQFITISPTGTTTYLDRDFTPTCMDGSAYHFFAKRGSENKLLMYYQGGGACWEQLTCTIPTCDTNVNVGGGDNPNNIASGFADLTNPDNPFREWNVVFVPYCSCDIHFGDISQDYDNANPLNPIHVEHRGYHNAKVAEKWAREHFVNPEAIFVTGSSAGSYGALFQAPLLHEVWPSSRFDVLGDAGNGVITPTFLQNEFNNWNFIPNLPATIPGVVDAITSGAGMPAYIEAVADFFATTNWANYSTAYDGGQGGQTGFYNIMLNDNNPLAGQTWWNASCGFQTNMRQQAVDTYTAVSGANDNYRYYIGTGSQHTMWGSNKVYTDTTGGVPTILDWVNGMLTSGPGWVNVEASPYNVLLAGDPKPSPLQAPFEVSGPDIIVNCP